MQRVAGMIKEAATRGNHSAYKVRIAVDDPGLTCGYLEMPHLSPEQMNVAIPTAVSREIPQPLQDVELYQLPVPALSDPKKFAGLFFLACPKAAIEARQKFFTSMGTQVASAEPGLLSLIRGMTRNSSACDEGVTAVISSGFRTTTVMLLRGGHPYFTRDFRLAGADFTYAFMMGEQCSWKEAEVHKLTYNVKDRDFQVESFVQRWLGEIKRSLDFAEQKYPALKAQKILLTGGTSLWAGLAFRIHEFLELPVECESWNRIQPSQEELGHGGYMVLYDIALGLVSQT